ncbi:MAG: flippase-like domain-containing protein [Bdellovibrionota bacterium]
MKSFSAKRLFLLAAGMGLFALLLWRAGPHDVLERLRGLGWSFALLLLMALAWNTVAALAWRILFDTRHPSIGFLTLWHTRLCGEAVNTLTPLLNLGGEPVKVLLIRDRLQGDQGAAYVLLDKTIFFLASLLFMASGLAVAFFVFSGHALVIGISALMLSSWIAGLLWLIVQQRKGRTVTAILNLAEKVRLRVSPQFRSRMEEMDRQIAVFWRDHPGRFLAALAIHFLGRAIRTWDVVLAASLLGMKVGISSAYVIAASVMLINAAFSFIPGALGAYEGSHGYFFSLLGLGLDAGISLAIIRRIRTLLFAGLSYLLLVFSPRSNGKAVAAVAACLAAISLGSASGVWAQEETPPQAAETAASSPPASEEAKKVVRLSLPEAIERALQISVELDAVRASTAVAESYVTQAQRARWIPKAELTNIFSANRESHYILDPSEDDDENINQDYIKTNAGKNFFERLSPFNHLQIDLVQPLYTFGKLDAALALARQGLEVSREKTRGKAEEITKRVSLLYWGLLVARDIDEMLADVRKNLDDAHAKIKDKLERETGEVTAIDLYEIESFRAKLAIKIQELIKGRSLVERTLALMLGLAPDETFEPAERRLAPPEYELKAIDDYRESALQNHPEMKQLRAGLLARQAQVDMARANLYPDLFLGARLEWTESPGHHPPPNEPEIDDPKRIFFGGPFIGLRWDLSLHRKSAELGTARAQLTELQALSKAADFGFTLRVTQAYLEVVRARDALEEVGKGLQSAKKWFRSATLNFGIGVEDTDGLIKAYKEYIELRGAHYQALFDYHQAVATLQQEAGLPLLNSQEAAAPAPSEANP